MPPQAAPNSLNEIAKQYSSMSDVEKRIADAILANPERVVNMTIKAFAQETEVSEGSVINFSNKVGFSGFTRLKINIAQHMPASSGDGGEESGESRGMKRTLYQLMHNAMNSFQMTYDVMPEDLIETVARELSQVKNRIEIYGVGSSAMIASDAYYRMMRIGLPAYAVTDPHINTVSASMLDADCIVLGISHTGRTLETLRAMEIAKQRGARTICLTSYAKCPLADLCDYAILVVAREAELYQEAVTARLTQLLILDAICQCVEARNGESALELRENLIEIIGEHRK